MSVRSRLEDAVDEFGMHAYKNRLETFKDWPFQENCKCTPEKLASAGFVYFGSGNEPDLVKCYVCLKELDGWEPQDDPWKEHVSHSGGCPFLKHDSFEDFTVKEYFELEKARIMNHVMKGTKHVHNVWIEKRDEVREKLFGQRSE